MSRMCPRWTFPVWFLDVSGARPKWKKTFSCGQRFSSSSIVAGLPHSLHGFHQFVLSLSLSLFFSLSLSLTPCCLLTFPPLQSFHLLLAEVVQRGVAGRNRKKERRKKKGKKREHKKSLTGWPRRDGVKGSSVIGLLCGVATPTGREEEWAGWANKPCFKRLGKEKDGKNSKSQWPVH